MNKAIHFSTSFLEQTHWRNSGYGSELPWLLAYGKPQPLSSCKNRSRLPATAGSVCMATDERRAGWATAMLGLLLAWQAGHGSVPALCHPSQFPHAPIPCAISPLLHTAARLDDLAQLGFVQFNPQTWPDGDSHVAGVRRKGIDQQVIAQPRQVRVKFADEEVGRRCA